MRDKGVPPAPCSRRPSTNSRHLFDALSLFFLFGFSLSLYIYIIYCARLCEALRSCFLWLSPAISRLSGILLLLLLLVLFFFEKGLVFKEFFVIGSYKKIKLNFLKGRINATLRSFKKKIYPDPREATFPKGSHLALSLKPILACSRLHSSALQVAPSELLFHLRLLSQTTSLIRIYIYKRLIRILFTGASCFSSKCRRILSHAGL